MPELGCSPQNGEIVLVVRDNDFAAGFQKNGYFLFTHGRGQPVQPPHAAVQVSEAPMLPLTQISPGFFVLSGEVVKEASAYDLWKRPKRNPLTFLGCTWRRVRVQRDNLPANLVILRPVDLLGALFVTSSVDATFYGRPEDVASMSVPAYVVVPRSSLHRASLPFLPGKVVGAKTPTLISRTAKTDPLIRTTELTLSALEAFPEDEVRVLRVTETHCSLRFYGPPSDGFIRAIGLVPVAGPSELIRFAPKANKDDGISLPVSLIEDLKGISFDAPVANHGGARLDFRDLCGVDENGDVVLKKVTIENPAEAASLLPVAALLPKGQKVVRELTSVAQERVWLSPSDLKHVSKFPSEVSVEYLESRGMVAVPLDNTFALKTGAVVRAQIGTNEGSMTPVFFVSSSEGLNGVVPTACLPDSILSEVERRPVRQQGHVGTFEACLAEDVAAAGGATRDKHIEERVQRLGLGNHTSFPPGWIAEPDDVISASLQWQRCRAAGWLEHKELFASFGIAGAIYRMTLKPEEYVKIRTASVNPITGTQGSSSMRRPTIYEPLSFEAFMNLPGALAFLKALLGDSYEFFARSVLTQELREAIFADLLAQGAIPAE